MKVYEIIQLIEVMRTSSIQAESLQEAEDKARKQFNTTIGLMRKKFPELFYGNIQTSTPNPNGNGDRN